MTVRGLIAGLAVGAGVSLAACGSDAPAPSGAPAALELLRTGSP